VVAVVAALVCRAQPKKGINWTAELNNREGDLTFMTVSVLASRGAVRSTAIELK
jgi:hypothetical protein